MSQNTFVEKPLVISAKIAVSVTFTLFLAARGLETKFRIRNQRFRISKLRLREPETKFRIRNDRATRTEIPMRKPDFVGNTYET